MNPTQALKDFSIKNANTGTTPANVPFDQQLESIKSQARDIVTKAQKLDPNIKISVADAQNIGMPKVNIPTQMEKTERPTQLDKVGTTPKPQTSVDVARTAILNAVPEEDRDTIDQILQASTGLQTERGAKLETAFDSVLEQQLANITSTRDRAKESISEQERMRLPELEAELESIRGENDVLTARKNAAIQAEERREGMSTAAKAGNVERISRDFNLEQANLAIRELASVGKINAATKLIDSKLDLKYGDLEAESKLLTAQLEAIKPFLDREDAKIADTRLQLNELVKTKIADARASDKALEEFKLQSYINAQQNGATPAVLSAIMSSDNREDVASVGGTFIQDPFTKSRLKTEAVERQKLQAQISEIEGSIVSTPEGSLIQIPTFDDYVSQKEQEAMQTLSPVEREKLRKEYEDEISIIDQSNKVARLSPMAREVINNPQAYYGFTPTIQSEIFTEFAKNGLDTNTILTGKKRALPATQVESISQGLGVKADVEKLYTMLKELPGTGPISGRLTSLNKYDPKRQAIESQITRIVPGLARGIFNEVGVLTDADVTRYANTLANPNMTDAQIEIEHKNTLEKINASIGTAIETFGMAGYDVAKFGNKVTNQSSMTDDEAYAEYLKITGQ